MSTNVRRAFIFSFLCTLLTLLAVPAAALGFEAGASSGLVVEKAPASGRTTLYLGTRFGCNLPAPGGTVDLEAGFMSGALLGNVLSASTAACFRFEGLGAWHPRLGLAAECDFGDSVFASTGSLIAPPWPQVYLGVRLDPARFSFGGWDLSVLETGIFTGSTGWFSGIRFEVSFLSLTIRW